MNETSEEEEDRDEMHDFKKADRLRDEEEAIRRAGEYRRRAKDRMRRRERDIPRLRNEDAIVQEVVKRVRAKLAQMANDSKK